MTFGSKIYKLIIKMNTILINKINIRVLPSSVWVWSELEKQISE